MVKPSCGWIFGMFLFLILGVPFAFAQPQAKEYAFGDRVSDRLDLFVSILLKKQERVDVLTAKISERRAEHYEFLLSKGKTEQATRFQEGTIKLTETLQKRVIVAQAKVDGVQSG